MRVSRDKARENRARVVAKSSALFREKGVEAVGISDLMNEAGLTHGGFYKQFVSKAQLVEEACSSALAETLAFWETYLEGGTDRRSAFIRGYLSDKHRDDVARGCLLPALAAEAGRQPHEIGDVFTRAIRSYRDVLDEPGETRTAETRAVALSTLSEIVGAVLLSRASNDAELSGEILAATRSRLLDRDGSGLETARHREVSDVT